MKNRITHLLQDWTPEPAPPALTAGPLEAGARLEGGYPLPPGVNMLMPAELCINRELLLSLLTASIEEINRFRQELPQECGEQERAEVEAALQQQLAFRTWVRRHPLGYISIALYPVAEADLVDEWEEPGS